MLLRRKKIYTLNSELHFSNTLDKFGHEGNEFIKIKY